MVNESGYNPLDIRILVQMDPIEEKTPNGFIKTPEQMEREKYAQAYGTLVGIGARAFMSWKEEEKPKVGDRIVVGSGVGYFLKGQDKKDYKLCLDMDVWGIKNF